MPISLSTTLPQGLPQGLPPGELVRPSPDPWPAQLPDHRRVPGIVAQIAPVEAALVGNPPQFHPGSVHGLIWARLCAGTPGMALLITARFHSDKWLSA